MGLVETFRGAVDPDQLGVTLIHEHIFVRNPELELNLPDGEWDPFDAVETAVEGLTDLYERGVRTVVDLTVPGLGRDVRLVARVAERAPVNLVATTGWYTPNVLPPYFQFHGPGRMIDGSDPLIDLFVRDIRDGIAGGTVRAGMLKVMTDEEGLTPDVARVMAAATIAHHETGVTITTHSHPGSRNGLEQQAFLCSRGVAAEYIVIGHSGDCEDLDYLRQLMDHGSTIGMDRFGMEHVLSDERRVETVVTLLELGYADRMVLSHDAAFYSHITPPSWRASSAPNWRMDTIPKRVIPMLRDAGVSSDLINQMLVTNPRRLLEGAS
ncbi:MAG TPA: phosphotriesterase-related protein [Acidimicrobiia bacterium]|nr:phosphotriesterase-related protein [Acidimicrobiia bacterium]